MIKRLISVIAVAMTLGFSASADELTIKMLPGENWWGVSNNYGRKMPFTESSDFKCDLRTDTYSHQTLSLMVSDRGRAVWCDEPFDVNIKEGIINLKSDDGDILLVEKAGSNLAGALKYAADNWYKPSGEEPELLYFSAPQYNTWIELTYHQNEKDILEYAQSMIDHGFPPGIFMIDDTWQAGYGDWRFEPSRFQDPKGMIDKLHAMGYKVLLWMCPYVSMDTPAFRRVAWGVNPDDVKGYPMKGGFINESEKPSSYGVPYPAQSRWWNGASALLDFSHPNGHAWFEEQLQRLVNEYGVDGFKFDGGDVYYYAGISDKLVEEEGFTKVYAYDKTISPAKMNMLYGEFAIRYKGSEFRSSYGLAGKPVIMRLHDKPHSWDALARIIPDMLAAGFVGIPYTCPDMVGGGSWADFIPGSPFSEELFVRSAQLQALCPMMQFSASPWRYLDEENQKTVMDAVALRQKFAPMFVELAKQAAKDGQPMMRNLEYVFPGMGYASVKDEFMMGDNLLVAPVLVEGATERSIILPPGKWRDASGKVFKGGRTIAIPVTLKSIPYFERITVR